LSHKTRAKNPKQYRALTGLEGVSLVRIIQMFQKL
jgi:hypothetical protein